MVDSNEDIYKLIQKYIWTTSDENFSRKFKLCHIYEVKKNETNFLDLGNKKLLWNYSEYKNHVTILSKGFRPLNKEYLPKCEYLFGKGLHFLDCIASIPFRVEANEKFVTIYLCEVSLGNVLEMVTTDFFGDQLPDQFISIKACGQVCPSKFTTYEDVEIPLGPIVKKCEIDVIII